MGFIFSKIFNGLFGKSDFRMLILGIDNAGKTTLLSCTLMKSDKQSPVPFPSSPALIIIAIGFNVETVEFKNLKFQVWDLGGQTSIRPYWRAYYPETSAIIYVIDSTDRERLEITKKELKLILEEEELKGVCLCVLANKQISEYMGLSEIKNRQWAIFKCSAKIGTGVPESMEWLANVLANQK